LQFVSNGKWNDSLTQEVPDGHTRWGLNNQGILKARHVDGLDTVITAEPDD